jgi:hypothetical protein
MMSLRAFPQETRINENLARLVSYSLVAMMMVCGALTIISLVSQVFVIWRPWYLVALILGASLEMLYSYRRFKALTVLSKEWTVGMATNLITIAFVVRVVVGLSHGVRAFLTEIVLWWDDFAYFFTYEFIIILGLVLAAWMVSGSFAGLLDEVGLNQAMIDHDSGGEDRGRIVPVRERLLSLILSVGSFLVILTALNRLNLRAVFSGPENWGESYLYSLPALAGGGATTLLYFMLALALLSQTQFLSLHTRWNMQHIPVSGTLARRWAIYSVLFLALLAGIVSLLPTSYALGLLSSLGAVLNVVIQAFLFAFQFLVFVLFYLISLIYKLLGRSGPGSELEIKPPELDDPALVAAADGSAAWWELVKSLLFWAVLIGTVIFALRQYLREHQDVLQALRRFPGFASLAKLWGWLRSLFAGVRQGISRAVQAGRERLRARVAASRGLFTDGYLSLRRLDARQRVYFFYLALVRRGSESGLTRGLSQTPYEYAGTLDAALPDVDEDVNAMTQAFIDARYSRRPIDIGFAGRVQQYWDRVRKALRHPKPKETGDRSAD